MDKPSKTRGNSLIPLITLVVVFLLSSISLSFPTRENGMTTEGSSEAFSRYPDQESDDIPTRMRRFGSHPEAAEHIDSDLYLNWMRAEHERWQREHLLLLTGAAADEPIWTSLGPTNGAGKMGPFAVHPAVAGTVYAASDGGGIWKTTDAGVTWRPVGDSLVMLSVLSLAIARSDPNVMYVGTGSTYSG